MGPKDATTVTWTRLGSFGELFSLCLWWAAWSLADQYLLEYTPRAELGVIGVCLFVAGIQRGVLWCIDCRGRRRPRRYASKLSDAPEGADGNGHGSAVNGNGALDGVQIVE